MNTDWEKMDQLFHQALECPNEERAEFIARAAQHDPALRSELQSLSTSTKRITASWKRL